MGVKEEFEKFVTEWFIIKLTKMERIFIESWNLAGWEP